MRGKYDWDFLVNGKTHVLKRGSDFLVTTRSMQVMCHNQAIKRGIDVETKSHEDSLAVHFFSYTSDDIFE